MESDALGPSLAHIGRWSVPTLSGGLTRHGESLQRIVALSLGVVTLSALLYPFVGGFGSNNSGAVFELTAGDLLTSEAAPTLARSLYFSVITFSTIGYGDLYPLGTGSRILVGLESLAGAVLVALFIFVLGCRTAR